MGSLILFWALIIRLFRSDFLQIVIWLVIPATRNSRADHANNTLALFVLVQYIPRLFLMFPLFLVFLSLPMFLVVFVVFRVSPMFPVFPRPSRGAYAPISNGQVAKSIENEHLASQMFAAVLQPLDCCKNEYHWNWCKYVAVWGVSAYEKDTLTITKFICK